MLKEYKTKELLEEIIRREGTQHICIQPYEKITIEINNKKQNLHLYEGPARIVLVYD
jgi:hypothetical protein